MKIMIVTDAWKPVAEMREPARVLHDAVEQIAVHDPEPFAVRGRMDRLFGDRDPAQVQADELAHQLVMIARNIDDPGALARAAQDLLHHIVVRLRPVPALLQLPGVPAARRPPSQPAECDPDRSWAGTSRPQAARLLD
ncbi:MAG: hypothetical protein ACREVO_19725 [Steroidobacteraceae bacterium]